MARIRSIHPGLFTDEAFVSLSPAAQVLWIGLWCEADDQGVFEWKPTMLKMRILPASTALIDPLLAELENANCIRAYSAGGRRYGVIRNFVRHQRPKAPKEVHPLPPELLNYAGFTSAGHRPNATTGRRRYAASSEQDSPYEGAEFGTGSECDGDEFGGVPEYGGDEGAAVRNEFGTSSEVVPNAALRWRMEDEGCKDPSRDERFQDVAQENPSHAHTRGEPLHPRGSESFGPARRFVSVGGAR